MSRATARLFDAMAATYDELEPWSEHLYAVLHGILRDALRPGPVAGPALDAGCGTGFQAEELQALGYEVHGVDLSAGLLAVARRRLPRAGLARADLAALPYRAGTFAAAACCGSTLSLVSCPRAALLELARVLRPGGQLLLECEHRFSLDLGWGLVSSLAGDALGYGLTPAGAWRQLAVRPGAGVVTTYPGYPALRLFTRGELARLLGAAGLRPVRAWGIHAVTNLIPSTVLHWPRLPAALGPVYRALRALDRAASPRPAAQRLAPSLVVLAERVR